MIYMYGYYMCAFFYMYAFFYICVLFFFAYICARQCSGVLFVRLNYTMSPSIMHIYHYIIRARINL